MIPAKFCRGRFAKTIFVTVGGGGDFEVQKFVVHEAQICHYSTFFKAACKKEWKASETAEITLSEDDPEIFELFVNFIYHQQLKSDIEPNSHPDFPQLISLYILADKLQVAKLKNAVMDALHAKRDEGHIAPSPILVKEAYKNTTEGSLLRKYLVDIWAYTAVSIVHGIWESIENYSGEFLFDLAKLQTERLHQSFPTTAPWKRSMCAYHEHITGFPCSNGK